MINLKDLHRNRIITEEEKAYNKNCTAPILCDDNCFHGIGFDTLKLYSILKHGILCEREAKKQNVYYNQNFINGENGRELISVAVNPFIHNTFNDDFQGFNVYIKNAISFVIDSNSVSINNHRDYIPFVDEGFVYNRVKVEDIKGIMVNSKYINKPISELEIGYNTLSLTALSELVNNANNQLKHMLNYKIPRTHLLNIKYMQLKHDKPLDNTAQKYADELVMYHTKKAYQQKYGIKNITLKTLIGKFMEELNLDIPVYDLNGNKYQINNNNQNTPK